MRYSEFIEKMRGSEPQMPHPEEVTGRILERIEPRRQDSGATAVQTPGRSSMTQWMRIVPACTGIAATVVMVLSLLIAHQDVDTAVRADIRDLDILSCSIHREADTHLEHYRKIKAMRQSYRELEDRAVKFQNHENRH